MSVDEGPIKIPDGTGKWIDCPNCRGDGEIINCYDDLCHAQGRCMHDGNDLCYECDGDGRVWMWFSETIERHPELKEAANAGIEDR